MNKNSNTYIITYATVMVVVVAAVLSIASISLDPRQQANVLIEKKGAILASIGQGDIPADTKDKDAFINGQYDKYITASLFVNAQGETTEASAKDALDALGKLPEVFEAKTAMPIFEAKGKDGQTLYVIPVTGKGLWGPVWGYVALGPDCNTVEGVVMDHKGETPGLGAEIAGKPFQAQFVGKQIFDGDKFESITLTKGVGSSEGNPFAVDAVSGGTLTSNGVRDMLRYCLADYVPFFEKIRAAQSTPVAPEIPTSDSTTTNNGGIE